MKCPNGCIGDGYFDPHCEYCDDGKPIPAVASAGYRCPHCKSDSGYYTKSIKKHEQSYTWDEEAIDCHIVHIKGGDVKYCMDCNKLVKR